jgi:hypothetical protein
MTPALLISFAVCSSVALPLSGMLIYHDITEKTNGNSWERALAALLETCQIGLWDASIFAVFQ